MPVNDTHQGVGFVRGHGPLLRAGVQHSWDQHLERPLAANGTALMNGYGFAGMARSYEVTSGSHAPYTLCKLAARVRGPERRSCNVR